MTLSMAVPWKQHFQDIEKELGIQGIVKFVIYQSDFNDNWYVGTVPVHKGSFKFRVGLHEKWRGKPQAELEPEGIVFVHNSGFIGAAKTYETAYDMALQSLQQPDAK